MRYGQDTGKIRVRYEYGTDEHGSCSSFGSCMPFDTCLLAEEADIGTEKLVDIHQGGDCSSHMFHRLAISLGYSQEVAKSGEHDGRRLFHASLLHNAHTLIRHAHGVLRNECSDSGPLMNKGCRRMHSRGRCCQ